MNAGWPIAAFHASSSMFTTSGGHDDHSRRASSADISSMRSVRPSTRPIVDTCSNWVSDWGPVKTYSAPTCRSRSEEHTSELQSRGHLVCRLLLEKKKHNETIAFPEKQKKNTKIHT